MLNLFKFRNNEYINAIFIVRFIKTSTLFCNESPGENLIQNANYEEPCELPSIIPTIVKRHLKESISISNSNLKPKQAWLETLKCSEDRKLGLLDLHPEVFGVFPRLDLINLNLRWQGVYKFIDYRKITTRPEVPRTSKKLWPQKGTGRARHGDRTAPQFIGGAQIKGPMGPRSYFSVLPKHVRLHGLTSSLAIKLAQDDLHFVDDLYLPTDDKEYLENLISSRNWGNSVLFVNSTDVAPRNIANICSLIPHFMVIPVYGVNVWSLLKYDTIIFTLEALNIIEEKIINSFLSPVGNTKSTDSFRNSRRLHDSWDQRQNTNFRGNPATHDDYMLFE